jgi:choline dehydrogenase-like flavoprotein
MSWNADTNSGNPVGLGQVMNSYDKKKRTTSYSAFLKDNRPTNLTLLPNARVKVINLSNGRASGVEIESGTQSEYDLSLDSLL